MFADVLCPFTFAVVTKNAILWFLFDQAQFADDPETAEGAMLAENQVVDEA